MRIPDGTINSYSKAVSEARDALFNLRTAHDQIRQAIALAFDTGHTDQHDEMVDVFYLLSTAIKKLVPIADE